MIPTLAENRAQGWGTQVSLLVSSDEHDGWLEECAGDALADGDEFPLSIENFNQWGLRKFRQVDLHAVAQTG